MWNLKSAVRKPKRFRLALTGAALSLTTAAMMTGVTGAGVATSSAATKYNIVLIPGLTTDPFYITMGIGAKAEAAKLGVNLEWRVLRPGTSRCKYRSSLPPWPVIQTLC